MYRAILCPCKHPACNNWLVAPVADIQGVCFTKEQAEAVAKLLNKMEKADERQTRQNLR